MGRCLSIFLFLLMSIQAHAELPTLSVRTFHVPPWVVIEDRQIKGVAMDDLRAFGELLPFAMVIEPYPWKRALNTSRATFPDPVALFPCTPAIERNAYFHYSEQFRSTNTVLLAKSGVLQEAQLSLRDYKERYPLRLAARKGHILQYHLKQNDIPHEQANSIEQLMQLLIRGRVDVIYDYDKVFEDYFSASDAMPAAHNVFDNTIVQSVSYGFCINRHSDHAEEYIEIINDTLKRFTPPPL